MKRDFFIMTNNPLVLEKHGEDHRVIYEELSYEMLLTAVRDKIHAGYCLLTHPLSGSVKPLETPYKSVLLAGGRADREELEMSIKLMENALDACRKFRSKEGSFPPQVLEDFKLIDLTLIESALASAES